MELNSDFSYYIGHLMNGKGAAQANLSDGKIDNKKDLEALDAADGVKDGVVTAKGIQNYIQANQAQFTDVNASDNGLTDEKTVYANLLGSLESSGLGSLLNTVQSSETTVNNNNHTSTTTQVIGKGSSAKTVVIVTDTQTGLVKSKTITQGSNVYTTNYEADSANPGKVKISEYTEKKGNTVTSYTDENKTTKTGSVTTSKSGNITTTTIKDANGNTTSITKTDNAGNITYQKTFLNDGGYEIKQLVGTPPVLTTTSKKEIWTAKDGNIFVKTMSRNSSGQNTYTRIEYDKNNPTIKLSMGKTIIDSNNEILRMEDYNYVTGDYSKSKLIDGELTAYSSKETTTDANGNKVVSTMSRANSGKLTFTNITYDKNNPTAKLSMDKSITSEDGTTITSTEKHDYVTGDYSKSKQIDGKFTEYAFQRTTGAGTDNKKVETRTSLTGNLTTIVTDDRSDSAAYGKTISKTVSYSSGRVVNYSYEYDEQGRVLKQTSSDTSTKKKGTSDPIVYTSDYTYPDGVKTATKTNDSNNKIEIRTYDENNNVTSYIQKTSNKDTSKTEYTYTSDGKENSVVKTDYTTAPYTITTKQYNSDGKLSTNTITKGDNYEQVTTYKSNGANIDNIVETTGNKVKTTTYGSDGLVSTVATYNPDNKELIVEEYTYDDVKVGNNTVKKLFTNTITTINTENNTAAQSVRTYSYTEGTGKSEGYEETAQETPKTTQISEYINTHLPQTSAIEKDSNNANASTLIDGQSFPQKLVESHIKISIYAEYNSLMEDYNKAIIRISSTTDLTPENKIREINRINELTEKEIEKMKEKCGGDIKTEYNKAIQNLPELFSEFRDTLTSIGGNINERDQITFYCHKISSAFVRLSLALPNISLFDEISSRKYSEIERLLIVINEEMNNYYEYINKEEKSPENLIATLKLFSENVENQLNLLDLSNT